jgi:acetoin utilization deacetylase AcuC-like enzyme
LRVFYCDQFSVTLPQGHRFPMQKYRTTRELVRQETAGVIFMEPVAATDSQLALAHTQDYIGSVTCGTLSPREQRDIGLPWSEALVERSRRSVGATIGACDYALRDGVAASLAGGTHHAFADHGSGFCVFNDAVVAARVMQSERGVREVAIVDLDVHQGDGSAAILARDPSIFTLSIHAQSNFPLSKQQSDLDVGLPDGTGDDEYLSRLDTALAAMFDRCVPALVIYLAGADPYAGDRLGHLALTMAGLAERDARVFEAARQHGTPIAVTMAGGYGKVIGETCEIHARTVAIGASFAASWPEAPRGMAMQTTLGVRT